MAHCGGRTLEAKLSSMYFSGGGHFGKIWPHPSSWRSPRQTIIQMGSQYHPSVNSLPKDPPKHHATSNLTQGQSPPTRRIRTSSTFQWAGTSPSNQEAYSKPPRTNFSHGGGCIGSKSLQKGDHIKNLYKMKRQRTITQIREQEKNPE